MIQPYQKNTPVRLRGEEYEELRMRVLRRDSWRCQLCGSTQQLEVHHQEHRSRSGEDTEENLITLCRACHTSMHS